METLLVRLGERPLLIALGLGLVGLILLELVALEQTPSKVPLAELPEHADQRVTVQATVTEVHSTGKESWVVGLRQGQARAALYVKQMQFAPLPGDLVTARGRVQEFEGRWELECEGDDVRLVSSTAVGNVELAQLALHPWDYVGRTLLVSAQAGATSMVEEHLSFQLIDHDLGYALWVDVEPGLVSAVAPIEPGETYHAKGELRYDELNFGYHLWLGELEHGLWRS